MKFKRVGYIHHRCHNCDHDMSETLACAVEIEEVGVVPMVITVLRCMQCDRMAELHVYIDGVPRDHETALIHSIPIRWEDWKPGTWSFEFGATIEPVLDAE